MKITKINIEIKEKFFLDVDGLGNKDKEKLEKRFKIFLLENKNIQIIEQGEIQNVCSSGRKDTDRCNFYSGYFVKYYEGLLVIEGKNIVMKTALNKSIMDLVLKHASGEIKELVKEEYREFETQLAQLIDKTEKKNLFGNYVVSKFKKLKNIILENSNNN